MLAVRVDAAVVQEWNFVVDGVLYEPVAQRAGLANVQKPAGGAPEKVHRAHMLIWVNEALGEVQGMRRDDVVTPVPLHPFIRRLARRRPHGAIPGRRPRLAALGACRG